MNREILDQCIQAANDCIVVCQQLIDINQAKDISEWNKRLKSNIEFYFYTSEQFKKLILSCTDKEKFKKLINLCNDVINECDNMINQCSAKPSDVYTLYQISKVQILQSILDNSILCIDKCKEFLFQYEGY